MSEVKQWLCNVCLKKKKKKRKENASFYLYFEMPRNSPEVGTLPSPCLCSRHSGSAQRPQVHQHRSVPLWFLGCLFLISRCHFEPFSVASSEPLTCVCTHSFRLADSLATRLLSSAQLLTFLTRFVDAAPSFTLSENSVVNGPSCLRSVYFTLLVLFVCLCVPGAVGSAGSSLPPSWWRSCGRAHVSPPPHQ